MKRALLFAALIICSTVASAVVYKWTDADGKVHYGDRPPDGVHAEIVSLLGTHAGAPPPVAARPAPPPAAASAPKDATQRDKQVDPADAAAAHEQECASAQARYKQLIDGRHLFTPGPNGERNYLTSEQIDAARLDAKKEVDTVCGASASN
jgi:hypothetical protein